MDRNAVPFPTTHQTEDPFVDKRPAVPPRLHSTPSLPNLLHPHHYTSLPTRLPYQGPARHRPHLRPLDLASSPSGPSLKNVNLDVERRPSLITPPLTPSSLHSNTNDTPSTPPDSHSPLRWINPQERDRVFAAAHAAYTAGLKPLMSPPNSAVAHNSGYLTPTSARSHSLSSDDGVGAGPGPSMLDSTSVPSGLAGVEITSSRDERPLIVDSHEGSVCNLDIEEISADTPTRLLLVRNVPLAASSKALIQAFSGMGDVKGILARFQATHGVIIIAFYDTRHALRASRQICGNPSPVLEDARLGSGFVSPAQVEKLTGKSEFLSVLDGSFLVTVEDRAVVPTDVRSILASFGELASFMEAGSDPHDQTFHVDYYDCRDAANAYKALNKRTIFGARLTLFSNKDVLEHPIRLMQGDTHSADSDAQFHRIAEGRARPRSVSTSEGVGTPDGVRKVKKVKEISQDHGRRSSNDLFFDAVGKVFDPSHATPSRPRSISVSAEDLAGLAKMQFPFNGYPSPVPAYPYPEVGYSGYPPPPVVQLPHPHMYPAHVYHYPVYGVPEGVPSRGYWTPVAPHAPQVEYCLAPPSRAPFYSAPMMSVGGYLGRQPPRPSPEAVVDSAVVTQSNDFGDRRLDGSDSGQGSQRLPGAKNALDITAIENGLDTRTTVMIKNIPNKMTDQDLKNFIDRVCPRRIDFMYLRMDFQNGCNVGYAFVNFLSVEDLLRFAKTQIGVKWNMYSSEKTLQMCYATYQGKESLVEKFKNSCIMDEKEAWRPKIYYSDGLNQGLPEPFPPPTHLRRKERSQHNRGALFVPGTHHQPSGGGALYHNRPHPPRMSTL